MENLIFSLNATVPIFVLMILGLFFRRLGWIDDEFASKMTKFAFMVPLPVMVFRDLATVNLDDVWDIRFVAFCFASTLISIGIAIVLSFLCKDRSVQGEFIQATYRSSASLLGIAFIQNIYGTSGMGPLMIIGSVPLYNVMAVIVLSFFQPVRKPLDRTLLKKTFIGIITNPIILGIIAGILWSAGGLSMSPIMSKTVDNLSAMATPMGLIAMGAAFDIKKAFGTARPAVGAALMKLVGFVTLFLPLALLFGFRDEKLVAILIMLGSATTMSCFVMAKNMGHEGTLTSSTVMLTTLFSSFSLTGWLFLLRTMGWI